MSNVPDELRYTRSHEWLRAEEDGVITVGLTDYGQDLVGRIDSVGLPSISAHLDAGDLVCTLASANVQADLRSLWNGEVIDVHEAILDSPGFVNSDPYGDGWLYKIRPSTAVELTAHLDATAYRAFTDADPGPQPSI